MNSVSIVKNIEAFVDRSEHFDKLFIEEPNVDTVRELTKCYMNLRTQHGILLSQVNKMMNASEPLLKPDTKLTDETRQLFYTISTLSSLTENVSSVMNNIDYQFKQIASNYPQFISCNSPKISLFVSKMNDDHVTILNTFNQSHPEYQIAIKQCSLGEKRDCGDMFGKNFSIHFKTLPMMFLVDGNKITELPIDNINSVADLEKLLE